MSLLAPLNNMQRNGRLYKILMAFSHFPGKSLKVTDASEVLSDEEIRHTESLLLKVAKFCGDQDPKEFADLHKLADAIQNQIPLEDADRGFR